MTSIIALANQFITERNWWQFHNPKNDSMNVLVEVCELSEHFNFNEDSVPEKASAIANEMADVLFASIIYAQVCSININKQIIKLSKVNSESTFSYEELYDLVLNNRESSGISSLVTARQVVISLINQARKLADFFIWCTAEQSIEIAKNKQNAIELLLARIFAHLVLLSSITDTNLETEFRNKMLLNATKYPIDISSAEKYAEIKDKYRN